MKTHTLKRSLGLTLLTLYGIGNILGAGIYALVGKVAGEAGMATPLAFLLSMVIAAFSAFSYIELVSRYPSAAGVSSYLHHAFGRVHLSRLIGLLMIAGGIVSAGVLAHAFAGYFLVLWPVQEWLAASVIIILIGLLALWGIQESAIMAAIFTLVELFGLALVLYFGRSHLAGFAAAPGQYLGLGQASLAAVLSGAFLAFYAYIGVEDVVNVAEETKNVRRNMPLAIIIASVVMAVLYCAVAIVAVRSVPIGELSSSSAPLALVFERTAALNPILLSFIGMAAIVNGLLAHIITSSRVTYGMSKRGWLHSSLAGIHHRRKTPTNATYLTVILVLAATLMFGIVGLAEATTFIILIIFTLVNIALLAIKLKKLRPAKGSFIVPVWVPVMGTLLSIGLIIFQVIEL